MEPAAKPKDLLVTAQAINEQYEKLRNWEGRPPLSEQAKLGEMLLCAKMSLRKRQYQPWLRENTNLVLRTGRRYVEKFKRYIHLQENPPKPTPAEEEWNSRMLLSLLRRQFPKHTEKELLRNVKNSRYGSSR